MAGSAALEPREGAEPNRIHNPLFRRVLATGVAGAALAATGLLSGATAMAAEPVVIEACTGKTNSSEFGQPIVASPSSLEAKVEQATLLSYPLRFDLAKQAREEFRSTGTVGLGSVTSASQTFSGQSLADAFASQITSLSTTREHADDVKTNVRNLAAVGCVGGARVPGQERPAPPPPPSSEPEKPSTRPSPAPGSSTPPSRGEPGSAPPSLPPFTSASYPASGAPSAVTAVPPGWAYVPGSLPPWAQSGQVPGVTPDVGSLLPPAPRNQDREDEVRAAGKAEAMPADPSKRVALPVLIAAIALAAVTAGLVRTWVLRRH